MSVIPLEILESLLVFSERIQRDIEIIASDNELDDKNSPHYSIFLANRIITLALHNARNLALVNAGINVALNNL